VFEHRNESLLPPRAFARRLGRSMVTFSLLLAGSLGFGMLGYHTLAGLGWVDSLLNASMILTGMGPVSPLKSVAAKLFASGYALFSGVIFLVACGIVLAPIAHRFLHRFHLDPDEDPGAPSAKKRS
jgi:hypothetical protein